jgi:hypothetical protein
MSAGWGIDVPGLLTRREIAEMAVHNDLDRGAVLDDEHGIVCTGERGMLSFETVVGDGDERLYRAQYVPFEDARDRAARIRAGRAARDRRDEAELP